MWRPSYPGELPTLGWGVLEWITENLAQPDCTEYQPLVFTREQAQFVLNFYRLNPSTGRRVFRRGVLSRSKGWGKSPIMGGLAAVEALGPVVFDGWDAGGRPVGRPWAEVRTPLVQLAAVSEDQTKNAYGPLLEMLREGPAIDNYSIEPMETFVSLPKGRIEFITSSGLSHEGNRPVFAALDQTEAWLPSNGGKKLAAVIRRNAGKVGGTTIETPNAFVPGERSVAEESAAYAVQINEGRVKDTGLLFDHREAAADVDMSDRDSLRDGLKFAYGDSATDNGGWVDLDRIVAEVWDPATDPQDARRFYLNQVTHAADSWISHTDLRAAADTDKIVSSGEIVVLGFDGSRGRVRGKADATALIGCRVSDGHIFEVGVWEAPAGQENKDWAPSTFEVDTAVRFAFDKFKVVGFYADPSGWSTQVAEWEREYGRKLRIKASAREPIAAWPRGKNTQVCEWVERFRMAVVEQELSFDGTSALTRHILNARRRSTRNGYLIYKEFPESTNKIDAAYAAVMAWKARNDAISAGIGRSRRGRSDGRRRVVTA